MRIVAPFPHHFAQRLAVGLREIGQRQFVLPPGPRLEANLDQTQKAGDEFLLQADILDTVVGNGARGARQDAAFDPDVGLPDAVGEPAPLQVGDRQIGSDHRR